MISIDWYYEVVENAVLRFRMAEMRSGCWLKTGAPELQPAKR